MAGKNIKGITIEIEGNTQPLQKALKGVDSAASKTTKEIREIDKSLKFDPSNITLLTQKQELLGKQVHTTKEKLETLKGAQQQVEAQFKSGDIGAEQYRAFQREVVQTENVLKGYENKLEGVNKALEGNGNSTKSNKEQLKELQNEQKQLASESEKVVSSFKLQESQMGSNASEADKLALAEQKIGKQSEIVERQIASLEKQLELAKQEYGENSVEVNKLETQLNESKSAFNGLANEMENLGSSAKQAGNGLSETNNLLKAELLNQFSEKLADISQKLVDFGKNALEAFREIDEGMDTIVTKTGAGGKALEEMQEVAKGIATEMPTNFSNIGQAVGEVNTQFQLTGDALKTTSKDIIKFAEINGSDVTNATIQSKQALEAYGLSVDHLSDVLDSTTYVAQGTGVSVDDLMKKATDGAPQIKMLGLSFDEAVTLIGQMEQHGVDSSAALSGLTKAAGAYTKQGKSMKEGLKETIDAIKNSKNETEAMSLAMEIFGAKKAPQMVDAIKRGTLSFEDLGYTAQVSAGLVSETYKNTLDPIDKFTTAQNGLKIVMGEVGGAIAETFAPTLEVLVGIFKQVAEWIKVLPGPIKQFVVILGTVVTVAGVLAPIFLTLQAAAVALGTSIGGMIAAALPIIGIAAAIAAGIAAVVIVIKYLWETNEGFRKVVETVWNTIMSVINTVIQAISDFVMSIWGTLVSWWNENQELIKATAEKIWNGIQQVIQVVMDIIGPFIQASWENISTVISTTWEVIKTVVETAINVVLGIIKTVMQIINGDWSGAWETIKSIGEAIWNGIKSVAESIFNALAQILSNIWNAISSTASNIWNGISSSLNGIWNSLLSTVSNVFNSISSTISNVFNTISNSASNVWNGIKDTIGGAINTAKNLVGDAINAIKGFFNFQISWPHIPLPHFHVSGSANPLDWLKGDLPSIGIDWYAKGGILTKPTIFGANGSNLMVGGEAGNEAVLPLNERNLSAIGRGIAETMQGQAPIININISDNVIREEADINKIASAVADKIAYELRRKRELQGGTT